MEHNRIFGLDLFRMAAILLILLANGIYILQLQVPAVAQIAGVIGFLGLEMFFVLSGFLLSKAWYPIFLAPDFGWRSTRQFIKSRLIRILPLYYLILMVNIAIAYGMDYGVDAVWKYFFLIQNFSKPIPAFFPESWGLPVIIFSIVALPLVLLAVSKMVSEKQKPISFVVVLIGLILIFIWTKWIYSSHTDHETVEQWDASLKTVALYRFDSVFIGALLGWLYQQRFKFNPILKWILAFFGCVGIVFISIGVGYFQLLIEQYKAFWNIFYLPIVSFSLALLLPLLSTWVSAPSFFHKPVVYLSRISYSIYLVHFSIVLLLAEHVLAQPATSHMDIVLLASVFFFGAIFLGIVVHHLIEKPFLKLLKK